MEVPIIYIYQHATYGSQIMMKCLESKIFGFQIGRQVLYLRSLWYPLWITSSINFLLWELLWNPWPIPLQAQYESCKFGYPEPLLCTWNASNFIQRLRGPNLVTHLKGKEIDSKVHEAKRFIGLEVQQIAGVKRG